MAANIAASLGMDEDYDDDVYGFSKNVDDKPDIFFDEVTIEEQRYLCEVLAPFAQTYLAVAQSLHILYQNSMLETEFIKLVINDLTK